MTFWDFCSPIYDFAQKRNVNYDKWINTVKDYVDKDSFVIELAGGTGEISVRIVNKVKKVICTDISEKMLKVARKKANNISNISFEVCDIYSMGFANNTFDILIASQVLHLLDNPKKAISEIVRVTKNKIILPVCLLKDIKGFAKLQVSIWKLLGFKPKYTFDKEGYIEFLENYGLKIIEYTVVEGAMPIMVVVCEK